MCGCCKERRRSIVAIGEVQAAVPERGAVGEIARREASAVVSTDEWMAPEVILGDKYDDRADVFSFGMILAELILYVGSLRCS